MDKAMWQQQNNYLIKEFIFSNFREALDFVNKVGEIAESLNHHPDILIYAYKNVRIWTMTHEEGKITDVDRKLAEEIDKL